jgi:hypothetical protein
MPRSTLDSDHRVRLVDHLGEEVPCQVAATSYWNPDKRDIQWLLVSFLADSAKDAGNRYRLEFGRDVRRAAPPVPLRVTETTSEVSIDTGAIGLVVDRRKATIFKEVRLGDRRVVAGDGAGAFLQDQNRKVFRSAWDRQAPEVTIEERGPIWASIRQQGWYAAKDGQRLCRYDIRIHAFAGQPCVRILHTWVLTHDSRKVQFGDISLRIPLAEAVTGCAFGADDRFQRRALEETLAHDRVSLVQEDSDRFAVHAWKAGVESLLSTGRRAGGWAAVRTKGASVLAHLRYLWQQYPAELEVTPGALAVHFWPEHGFSFTFRERPESYGVHRWPYSDGPLMDLQPRPYVENVLMKDVEKIKGYDQINALGMSKTQEVWLDFAAPERDAAAAQEQALRYEQPIAARAGAEWIAGSLALRPLAVKDEKRFPAVERAIRARWDGETYLQDRCHDYGWLHYGDRHSQDYPFGPAGKFASVHRY